MPAVSGIDTEVLVDEELVGMWKLKEQGARDTVGRVGKAACLEDFLGRAPGGGRRKWVATYDNAGGGGGAVEEGRKR